MTKLEELAKGTFQRYCQYTKNEGSNWHELSAERKKVWMLDILCIVDHVTEELRNKFKEVPTLRPNTTSYFKGYNDGIMEERTEVKNFIENVLEELENDLAD